MKSYSTKNPVAYITKNKQRLKQNGNVIYLKDNDEFEIELFNPTTFKVLAEITIDNKSIGDSIILRPGERVFLERYTGHDPKKFKYATYTVNNTKESLDAITYNGDIDIRFYMENIGNGAFTIINNWPMPVYDNYHTTFNDEMLCTASCNTTETGIVEKGSHSTQNFRIDNSTIFENYSFHDVFWKIKPKKYIETKDIIIYCTKCGTKKKKTSYKFCPICGNKF